MGSCSVPRILVVDDDEATRYATVKLLSGAGYEAVGAHDYRDALSILEDGSPLEIAVFDVVLPHVHGFALARMAHMKRPYIKCIYMTGFDLPTGEANGPVLRKPVADGELLVEVAKALTP
jgi:CheY-like chemotaxis protein